MASKLAAAEIAKRKQWMAERLPHTLCHVIGMEMLELDPDRVVARMPVDERTHMPAGILHGGASVALAESVASMGAALNVPDAGLIPVGIEINANHIRGMQSGWVTAVAVPVHRGKSTQVWSIELRDEADNLICTSRCTLGHRPAPKA